MRNVTSDKIVNVGVMDPLVREVLGDATVGMSSGPNGSVIHLVDGNAQAVAIAQAAFDGYWALTVMTDKVTIQADDTDMATITCRDAKLAGLNTMRYHVLLDGLLYAQGVVGRSGEEFRLELTSEVTGRYVIVLWSGITYQSGAVIVEAE